jgi:hypothetical protein
MNDRESNRWESLVAGITRETTPLGDGAPYGFATRVVAQWRQARRDEALRRWSFWSLRAALGSVAACGLLLVLSSRQNDAPILLPPPPAEFIALPLTSP